MPDFLRDLRFGLRLLARSPVFTATAALLLAIGISANTLIFSVVDALLLRPLPVAHPEQLVRLIEVHPTGFVTFELPYAVYEAPPQNRPGLSPPPHRPTHPPPPFPSHQPPPQDPPPHPPP